ncbi:calcium-binding protein [Nocardioides islandensis]|uniref:Calcium-binding protein n=1 Tax=Nocardioides islandensis TaxID=433663 RepID=A0A930YJI9_9ACTN|nr:calcium-binding protein [Nocardioides islandensis]MBF4765059.1 calcium-binding protein [Nocardioides islandensis]
MHTALAGAIPARTALRLSAVTGLMALSLVGVDEEARARPAAAKAVAPTVMSSHATVEACANDATIVGAPGCDEKSETGWTSFSAGGSSTEGAVHAAGSLAVSTQTTSVGLEITAKGSSGISSGVSLSSASSVSEFGMDFAVGALPVNVAVTGTIDVSGAPCTDSAAHARVTPGDGSPIEVTCPGPGQSIDFHFTAGAGTTITFEGAASAGLINESESASASFDLQMLIGDCTHIGTAGPDVLVGTPGNDVMCGLGGDDTLRGLGGDDRLVGGDGRDVLFGGENDDTLEPGGTAGELSFGGPGNDTITGGTWQLGGSGTDIMIGNDLAQAAYGCGGDDQLTGAGGDDGLTGDRPAVSDADILAALGVTGQPAEVDCSTSTQADGSDTLLGQADDDSLNGGAGNDLLAGGTGLDTLTAGEGVEDLLLGGPDHDVLNGGRFMLGGSGPDTMEGSDTRNAMYGCGGKDTMNGNGFSDLIIGGSTGIPDAQFLQIHGIAGLAFSEVDCSLAGEKDVKDVIKGGQGDDEVEAGPGNDDVDGQSGDDDIKGEDGDDHLRGGTGRDKLRGGENNDNLAGNKAFDIMDGQGGRDTLLANDGVKDKVRGGPGKDRAKVDNVDEVTKVETLI